MIRLSAVLSILLIITSSTFASPLTENPSSCFTGKYETRETYLAAMQKVMKGEVNKDQKEKIAARYTHWKKVDSDKVSCQFFTYRVDDIPVTGFILKPRDMKEADLLPVIFNRGGNADDAIETPYLYDKLAPLARKGFLVVGSFYRGAKINGVASRYRLADQFGGEDVNDVLQLIPIIDSIEGVKGKRIGMWGISRGGFMAFLAAKKSDRFSAIVADSAPVDLVAEAESTTRMDSVFETWIPRFKEHREVELKKRSVRYWYKELNQIPLLIVHGSNDKQVSPLNILAFAQQLQQSGYPYELMIYHAGEHGLRGFESDVNTRVANWFKKYAH